MLWSCSIATPFIAASFHVLDFSIVVEVDDTAYFFICTSSASVP